MSAGDKRFTVDEIASFSQPKPSTPPAAGASPPSAPVVVDVPTYAEPPLSPTEILKKLRSIQRSKHAPAIQKILAGESFAPPGTRDAAMMEIAGVLAVNAPDNDPKDLADLLRPSLSEWAAEDGATLTVEQEVEKAIEKISRAQIRARQNRAERKAQEAEIQGVLIASARQDGKNHTYTDEEISKFAASQNTTVEDFLRNRLIIQLDDTYWIWGSNGYLPPVSGKAASSAISADLAPFGHVRFKNAAKNGVETKRPVTEMVDDYGSITRFAFSDLTVSSSHYDPVSRAFHEACAAVRKDLAPKYDNQVQTWLNLLGGNILLDWLAVVTELDRQCQALYLWGDKGVGKSMLAQGLARLWNKVGNPTEMSSILGTFNADLLSCPLVWADEALPHDWGKKSASTRLRELLGTESRTVGRKYLANTKLKGALRFLLTANNENMIALGEEDTTPEDRDAFSERFIKLHANPAASQYLITLGGRSATADWVTGDRITQHILWLKQNRKVAEGDRYRIKVVGNMGLSGLGGSMNNTSEDIFSWIGKYIADPMPTIPGVLIGDGEVLINSGDLATSFPIYLRTLKTIPSQGKISRALASISSGQVRRNGQRYHCVLVPDLLHWIDNVMNGDVEYAEKYIKRSLAPEATCTDATAVDTNTTDTAGKPN